MTKNRNTVKIVGYISKEIVSENNILEYENKEIVQSTMLDIHTNKHANDFFSIDSYHNTLMNIDKIINKPYYVEYDKKKDCIKYYGKADQYVCVIVKVKNKKDFYVSTFYPQSRDKIDKLKNK